MNEKNVDIETKDGIIDTFVCHPKTEHPLPAIIFYMDAPGIREELRDMARRLSGNGYYVLLPNLFYRHGTEGNYPFNQEAIRTEKLELKKMLNTMAQTTNSMIINDTKQLLNFCNTELNVKNSGIGILGYCMSGQYVVSCASSYPNQIKALASFYGVGIYTKKQDSPHLVSHKIKGEIYLAFAEQDKYVEPKEVDSIINHFSKDNINCELEVYKGTDHGFAFPDRYSYQKEAAEKHWVKLLSLFHRNLK